jgi:thioesterase domain-containing protein
MSSVRPEVEPDDEATLLLGLLHGLGMNISLGEWRRLGPDERLFYAVERARAENIVPPGFELQDARRMLAVCHAHQQALHGYVPRIYPDRICLFRAREPQAPAAETPEGVHRSPTLGWESFCAEPLDVIDVPGDHVSIMSEPHVIVLAERLRSRLLAVDPVTPEPLCATASMR